ncbi:glycerophosphodiester phosphodiesterase [Scopulibacillus darangshiensis]|uniref:glycerophosphodiester phosphodiesterase n=1 Tax=Scopulibacillus darangshiensis TaxID=442528 RepID=UPI001FB1AB6F|nr:glycerophosphodiester phosphodiesterase [Scopulibacillus darangshiensis]
MVTTIFAHRGYSAKYPENTMVSFKAALKSGAQGIECDVQLSKDGIPVVIHDETLNRTTNGIGFVKDYTAKQLASLNAGRRFHHAAIPTLKEVLAWISPTNLLLNIELKNKKFPYNEMEEKVITMIHDFQMENRTIYSSFNHDSLIKIAKIDANAETAPLYKKPIPSPWRYAKALRASAIHPNYRSVNKELIDKVHDHHFKVRAYTVNNASIMKKLISWGIDGIITDDPYRGRFCLEQMNK